MGITTFEHAVIANRKLRLIFNEQDYSEYRLEEPHEDEYIGRWGIFYLDKDSITIEFLDGKKTFKLRRG